jgi:hypothetical protein
MQRLCLFLAFFAAAACGLSGCGVVAQDPPQDMVSVSVGAPLKAGDRLDIRVVGEEDFSGIFPIGANGTLSIEPLGEIEAAGLDLTAFRERLHQRLLAGYLKAPELTVKLATRTKPAGDAPDLRSSQVEGRAAQGP